MANSPNKTARGLGRSDGESPPLRNEPSRQVANPSYTNALLFAVVVLFILATRFWALGAKPFHHDESLFASHSYYLSQTGDYDFNPILHGPFLEDISALIFRVFGDGDATARLWSALAGTLLLLAVWWLRELLGRLAAGLAVLLLAVSPTLLFYSRFNRNDVPFTLAALLFVALVARFIQRGRLGYWFLALLAAAWMICIKETYVIFLFTAATYVVGLGLVEAAAGRPASWRAELARLARERKNFWGLFAVTTAAGLAAGAFLIVLLYTTFFRHMNHAAGPLEAIRYWKGQHAEQRIFGEFHYYVPILISYEFLPLALFAWGVARTLRRAPWLRGWVAWGWAAWSAALFAVLWPYTLPREAAALTHLTRGWQLWLAVEVFALGVSACAVLATEGRRLEAFFVWWAVISFLAYSYAGEKVPWIAVHIIFPMIMTAAIFAWEILSRTGSSRTGWGRTGWQPVSNQRLSVSNQSRADKGPCEEPAATKGTEGTKETQGTTETDTANASLWSLSSLRSLWFPRPFHTLTTLGGSGTGCQPVLHLALVTAFAATIAVALRLSFVNCANPAERNVYTHTTADYKAMVADIHDLVTRTGSGPVETFPLILNGDSVWPGQWYFRRWQAMRYGPVVPRAPIIIVDEYLDPQHRERSALAEYPWLLQTHVVRRVPFREWWHQELLLSTVGRLLDSWMALVPKQYRGGLVTDAYGRRVGFIGDRAGLPNMTIEDEIAASRHAWRDIYDYLVYRRDFDPYRTPYPTRGHMSVLLCVEKELYRKWTRLGGRHEAARTRFVRH